MGDIAETGTEQPDAVAWAAWTASLADAAQALTDGSSLTVSGPEDSARPVRLRKARLGGFIPAKHEVVTPWVRLARVEDFLRGHCIGSELIGARFPLSPDEDAALLALGWHHPTALDGPDYLRFWPDDVPQAPFLPREDAERAAAMVAATFRDVLAVGAESLPTLTADRPLECGSGCRGATSPLAVAGELGAERSSGRPHGIRPGWSKCGAVTLPLVSGSPTLEAWPTPRRSVAPAP